MLTVEILARLGKGIGLVMDTVCWLGWVILS